MKQSSFQSWFHGIKGKLLFAAALPVIGFAIVFGVAKSGMSSLNHFLENAHKNVIPNVQALGEMRQARNKFGYQIFAAMSMTTAEKRDERLKIATESVQEYENAMNQYEKTPFVPETEKLFAPAKAIKEEYLSSLRNLIKLVETGKPEAYAEVHKLMDGRIWEMGKIMSTKSGRASAR